MKLTKAETKLHNQARELLVLQRDLKEDEIDFVYENWNPGAVSNLTQPSAFFTPTIMARELSIETDGDSIIDLCAGIGSLSRAILASNSDAQIVCIEREHAFVEVGRKLLPQATWLQADVLDELPELLKRKDMYRTFDMFISNPPFGKIPKTVARTTKFVSSGQWEYAVAELGMSMSNFGGAMIVPVNVLPWQYSGMRSYTTVANERYEKWSLKSGIKLRMNCGIDVSGNVFKNAPGIKVELAVACRKGEE
jgi:phospholipid N-methyltransferase